MTLSFSANAQGGMYCPFDALIVTNVTRGWTETLAYPDTVLLLHYTSVGIVEQYGKVLRLSEAYPNPFTNETNVSLDMPAMDEVFIQVVRIDGVVVANCQYLLAAGSHIIKVGLSSPSMAFLIVTTARERQVVRMLCTGNDGRNFVMVESGSNEHNSTNQIVRSNEIGEFQPGDMMRYTAVLFDGANEVYSNTITQQQYESQIVTLSFDLTTPEVVTNQVIDITQTSAKGGGNVTATGGVSVTERGICWSTNHNPTTSDSHFNNGTGTGTYTVQMNALTAGATYSGRAYAINRYGTAYGNEMSFTTLEIPSYTIGVTANPSSGGSVSGEGTYQQGQSCTVHATANTGYTFTNWTENGSVLSTNANYTFQVTGNRTLVANFTQQSQAPIGAINGLFTINANGDQVYFSQGNLQYKASTNTWQFAANQYDYIGDANSNISSSYSGWIDLFGWGTSGWNCGNTYYCPWDSDNSDGSLYGPPGQYDLTGNYANSDWGYYNAISNGGNQSHQWRTLTGGSCGEWNYVFNTRSTTSGIRYAKAQVNNVHGVILLPDNWSSSYYTLYSINDGGASYSSNVISASTWANSLEAHGAVFLPAANSRDGTSYVIGIFGVYWSASYNSSNSACGGVAFNGDYLYTVVASYRATGRSVRLVCPAN